MRDDLLPKITSKGFWRINLRPFQFERNLTLLNCAEVVDNNKVRLRGWDYPHIQRNKDHGGQGPAGDYYESWTDWTHHIEFWRMYRSSQFLHYRALWEDWWDISIRESARAPNPPILGVVAAIYTVTEIFEFAGRLARAGVYSNGVAVDLSLGNVKDRSLWVDEARRMGFLEPRRSLADTVRIQKTLPSESAKSSAPIALDALMELFDNFGWEPSRESIEQDQANFLAGRM